MSEPILVQKFQTQMAYLSQRQALLAQNIANIDTPSYRSQDLKKLNFDDLVSAQSHKTPLRTTSPKHLASSIDMGGPYATDKDRYTFDKKPRGNNVVLDEQLGKVSDVGAQNQLTTTLLKKYNQFYTTALGTKGS